MCATVRCNTPRFVPVSRLPLSFNATYIQSGCITVHSRTASVDKTQFTAFFDHVTRARPPRNKLQIVLDRSAKFLVHEMCRVFFYSIIQMLNWIVNNVYVFSVINFIVHVVIKVKNTHFHNKYIGLVL